MDENNYVLLEREQVIRVANDMGNNVKSIGTVIQHRLFKRK